MRGSPTAPRDLALCHATAELRPFPTHVALSFEGHEGRVRSISVDPSGQWLVTGCDDGTVRLWNVTTGRCVRSWVMPLEKTAATETLSPAVVRCVAWCPDPSIQVKKAPEHAMCRPIISGHPPHL